jgi:hypothetical protein
MEKLVRKPMDLWGRVGVDAREIAAIVRGVEGVEDEIHGEGGKILGESDMIARVDDIERAGEGDGQKAAARVTVGTRSTVGMMKVTSIPMQTFKQC